MTFSHVRGIETATITASDRTCQRSSAPRPLPESDVGWSARSFASPA